MVTKSNVTYLNRNPRIWLEEAVPWLGSGRARVLVAAEKLPDACSTNACSTMGNTNASSPVEERRFSAAQSPQNQCGLQPLWSHFVSTACFTRADKSLKA